MANKRPDARHTVALAAGASAATSATTSAVSRINPLVFISHDSRDAHLAEAFDHLLTDASGGVVRTFRSSDQSGRAGIDYGETWYSKIAKMLGEATDVVALLTPSSVGRPWILFEAGFAVGRLDTKVFGIALGLPLAQAVTGPFAQFQNCEANEESLTTVVLQLIQRNPNARPREQAVRRQVSAFLQEIELLLKQRASPKEETQEEMNATAVAKLFEEVKVMFRDLPSRVESELRGHGSLRRRRRFHPMMLEELLHFAYSAEAPAAGWLLLASFFRDEWPWLAEPTLEVYRAVQSGDPRQIEKAHHNLRTVANVAGRSRLFFRHDADEEAYFAIRHLPEMLEHFASRPLPEERKARRPKQAEKGSSETPAEKR